MIAVGYFDGIARRGMLVWREYPDGTIQALGGVDATGHAADPQTVVTTDASERILAGWVHPDNIEEVRGLPCPY